MGLPPLAPPDPVRPHLCRARPRTRSGAGARPHGVRPAGSRGLPRHRLDHRRAGQAGGGRADPRRALRHDAALGPVPAVGALLGDRRPARPGGGPAPAAAGDDRGHRPALGRAHQRRDLLRADPAARRRAARLAPPSPPLPAGPRLRRQPRQRPHPDRQPAEHPDRAEPPSPLPAFRAGLRRAGRPLARSALPDRGATAAEAGGRQHAGRTSPPPKPLPKRRASRSTAGRRPRRSC